MHLNFEFNSIEEFIAFLRLIRMEELDIDATIAEQTQKLKNTTEPLKTALDQQGE